MAFKEFDVSRDRAAAEEMVGLTGQMGVPVIVINGQAVIGFDRARIRELLSIDTGGQKPLRFGLKVADAKEASTSGALVGGVTPGLPGERAGLKEGDIITKINGKRINGAADMARALTGLKPGDIVTILFLRGTKTRKSEIVI